MYVSTEKGEVVYSFDEMKVGASFGAYCASYAPARVLVYKQLFGLAAKD